jgi:hypothetical protein
LKRRMERRKGEPRVGKYQAWFPVERNALAEAFHDACYAAFLEDLEELFKRNPRARLRLDKALLEFRRALFSGSTK